jgi:anti-anti-sigma factor
MPGDERQFDVRRDHRAAGLVVSPAGEIDLWTAPEVQAALTPADGAPRIVVLDLRAVTFMDSSGLGLIVGAYRRARQSGTRFAVAVGVASDVQRILEISGVAKLVELVGDPAELVGGGGT